MPSPKEVINTSSGSEWSRVPVQIKYTNSRDIDLGSILDHQKEATRTICREVHDVKEEVMESRDSILSNMATEFKKIKDLAPTISVTQDDLVKALHVSWQGTKLLENVNREELTVVLEKLLSKEREVAKLTVSNGTCFSFPFSLCLIHDIHHDHATCTLLTTSILPSIHCFP